MKLELKLRESHFAYEMIKKMLENEPKDRPNSTEIIQTLPALKDKKIKEFHHLCSLENPTEEEIEKNSQNSRRRFDWSC